MGDFGDVARGIVVLNRECGSSGKTIKYIVAWYDGLLMFAFISPQYIICLRSHRALFVCLIFF